MDSKITVFDKITNAASRLGYGTWTVKLIVYDGRVVGFDEVTPPLESFREKGEK